ncbi:competence protein CoiA [Oenococcus oeni]|uniref:competence protein CoiA n=1 Tax=Oenococcus oeni TaxID=1247 RepID=UPI0010B3090A|nr:competence protein CoiA family protein [Oenococcus oeni]SYW07116.1 putative Competence protein (coiA) [Oenococcus oeni]
MLVAKDCHNVLVEAGRARRGEFFYCPFCKKRLLLCHGEIRIPYFAHSARDNCNSFSENESEIHLLAKQKIKEATERLGYRAELEKVLPLISQRADLIISDSAGKELAIEFQQSPISIPRLRERNQGYKSIGLSVIWFLGPNYSFTNPSQRTVFKFADQETKVYYYDQNKHEIIILTALFKRDYYKFEPVVHRVPFNSFIKNFFLKQSLTEQSEEILINKKILFKQANALQKDLLLKRVPTEICRLVYKHRHINVACGPWIIHQGTQAGLKTTNWHWRLMIILELEEFGQDNLCPVRYLSKKFTSDKYFYERSIESQFAKHAFLKLLQELVEKGIIDLKLSYVLVKKLPIWFENYQQKLFFLR